MKRLTLFSYRWKLPALLLLLAAAALAIANDYYHFEPHWLNTRTGFNWSNNNLTDEIWLSGIVGSLLILCFCRERNEDEYIQSVRLRAWQTAIVVNYALFILSVWLVYGASFMGIVMYNVLTPLIIYLAIFYTRLYVIPKLSNGKAAL